MVAMDQHRQNASQAKKSDRVYLSHSRSRQLLPLPTTPTKPDHLRAFVPRGAQKSWAPTPRAIRIMLMLMAAAAAFITLQTASPPLGDVSFANMAEHQLIDRTVIVDRPSAIHRKTDASPPTGQDTAADAADAADATATKDRGATGDSLPEKAPATGEFSTVREPSSMGERQGSVASDGEPDGLRESVSVRSETEETGGAARGFEAEIAAAAEVAAEEEAKQSESGMFRDPADFDTFDENTALNYFHLHKTGGVSFKFRLFDFFTFRPKINRKGVNPRVMDTCHMSGKARPALGIEAQWSCDWGEIEVMPEKERNAIDVIVGHQYWERGAGYWLPNRDLRCFTVMRHPLHRKVSFFYHFFVRNAGRSEDSVTEHELVQFILGKEMPSSPLVRDAGPSYYASRLWSDGVSGYDNDNNRFVVPDETAGEMVFNSIRRLRRNFVFVGLQTQETASLCMLRKTVERLSQAHGFDNLDGLEELEKQKERLNTGSYALSAELVWAKMTPGQRDEFKRVERVDLAIYREGKNMFHEMAKRFDCDSLVVDAEGDDIAL